MRIEATVILNRCVDYLSIGDTGSRNQIESVLGLSKIITSAEEETSRLRK